MFEIQHPDCFGDEEHSQQQQPAMHYYTSPLQQPSHECTVRRAVICAAALLDSSVVLASWQVGPCKSIFWPIAV
jgi:hypothetical protein